MRPAMAAHPNELNTKFFDARGGAPGCTRPAVAPRRCPWGSLARATRTGPRRSIRWLIESGLCTDDSWWLELRGILGRPGLSLSPSHNTRFGNRLPLWGVSKAGKSVALVGWGWWWVAAVPREKATFEGGLANLPQKPWPGGPTSHPEYVGSTAVQHMWDGGEGEWGGRRCGQEFELVYCFRHFFFLQFTLLLIEWVSNDFQYSN